MKHVFYVNGIKCQSCVSFIENGLSAAPGVFSVNVSLKDLKAEIEGDFGNENPEIVARNLNEFIKERGYSLGVENKKNAFDFSEFNAAVPIAGAVIALFIVLQKFGIVNLVSGSRVGFGTAVLIGAIASVSTCMAVVGGLVLSVSASFAKEGYRFKPQAFFHAGRFASFFVLGGVIGVFGSAFQLQRSGTFILGFIVGVIMIILGVNLLNIFPWMKKFQPTMPKFIGDKIHNLKNFNSSITPFLIGVVTFFLPCGFTQSMQVYTLTTGNFLAGALTMFLFAVGTFPVLALLSFGFSGFNGKLNSGVFFKASGIIVIFFALLNLYNSFAAIGLVPPFLNL